MGRLTKGVEEVTEPKTRTGYKVVRQDMTACFDGETKYAVGETTKVEDYSPKVAGVCGTCVRGIHACHRPEDTLAYRRGNWPLRLLRVEVAASDVIAENEEKMRCKAVKVVEELPIARAFGPHGEEVVAFIKELPSYPWCRPPKHDRAMVEAAVAEYLAALEKFGAKSAKVGFVTDRNAAHTAARSAAESTAWDATWDAARIAAYVAADTARWDSAHNAAWGAAYTNAFKAVDGTPGVPADAEGAWNAAHAAAHIVIADELDFPNPFAPLMRVWKAGYWPIGMVRDEFVVYEPPVGGE